MKVKTWIFAWACAALLGSHSYMAAAQDPAATYPSRPVTVIVVVTPGGVAETEVRIYTPKLQENLGKPFIFDYKPGAGGSVGFAFGAKAAPDGYTIVATSPAFTTAPAVMAVNYDPIKDYAPVVQLGRQFGMVVVHPSVPVTNIQEYIAYARANPGKLNFGAPGIGSTSHLVGSWLGDLTRTETTFVFYKGTAQVQADMLAGVLHVTASSTTSQGPHVKAGKLRAIATTGAIRSPAFPDLRTSREQGLGDFDYPFWIGITAPAKTPPAIINKLNAEFLKVQKLPETRAQLERIGSFPMGGSPSDFGRLIGEEVNRWKELVKKTGIKAEQ